MKKMMIILSLWFMQMNAEEFSYDAQNNFGPSNWNKIAKACIERNQSPINIVQSKVQQVLKPGPKLQITKWKEIPIRNEIENNGHTFIIRFLYKDGKQPSLSFGPLPQNSQYYLHELHYHFGLDSSSGSEHLINGHAYAAESHLVFYNRMYGTLQNAIKYPDGLAVFARFYEASDEDCELHPFIPYLRYIKNTDQAIIVSKKAFSLKSVLGSWRFDYYTYWGSLTTPLCSEAVRWIIAVKPLQISNRQLHKFRNLKQSNGKSLAPNFRPIQRLNGRVVQYLSTTRNRPVAKIRPL